MSLIITSIISLLFSFLSFLILRESKASIKCKLIMLLIMFIGVFVRLYRIEVYPVGLNQDEASIGYEAISIFNYGVDRFGMSYPVHLISWGSGQNALYAYLIMPFVKIIMNDALLIRLPMALFGSFTLLCIMYFVKHEELNNKGIIILLLYAIMPWHIMKSRWGLESNIFPDVVFYGLLLLYFGIKNKKKGLYILSAIVFGISTYAYGTSYLYIPIMLILIYGYLIKSKRLIFKEGILYFLITGLVALPMILFVIINYFNLDSIKVFNITIPRLYANRFMTITSVNGNFLINCINNMISLLKIIILQYDNLPLNAIFYFGTFYAISLPFLIYGLIIYFKQRKYQKKIYLNLVFLALIAGLIVGMMVEPNINRVNFLWIPFYAFVILGIINISNKYFKSAILLLYVISFLGFNCYYYGDYQQNISRSTNLGLEKAIKSIDTDKNIYITDTINQPYIFWLYYKKISPYYYIDNRHIQNEQAMFQVVDRIDKVQFYVASGYELAGDSVYVLPVELIDYYATDNCKIKIYDNFGVLDC